MAKRTSPSKWTIRQMQEEVHTHAMATLEKSVWWTTSTEDLKGIKAMVEGMKINQSPAVQIAAILEMRGEA